ncbi:MAG TPA: hypothetical protein VL334_20800 [Anaerolineae bacterium]|nr:hypothetical protein [Anaerolineae bacterium]
MKIVKSERINLLARSHGYFPAAFRWRDRRFDVTSVEKCWTVQRPAGRRMFRVRCAAGSFVLEQCVASDSWRVNRWPLTLLLPWPKPAAPARFPLPRSQRRPPQRPLASQPSQLAAPAPAQAERRPKWTTASQRL